MGLASVRSTGWICIVAPGDASWPRLRELIGEAHAVAKAAHERARGHRP